MKLEQYSRQRLDKYSRYMDLVAAGLLGNPKNLKIPENFNFSNLESTLKTNRVHLRWIKNANPVFGRKFKKEIREVIKKEKARVDRSLKVIKNLSEEFEKRKLPFIIIKTMDNLPDIGNDIDVYANAPVRIIDEIFLRKLKGVLQEPTVSDRLARKRNYIVNRCTVEIHCTRLGQVGEDTRFGKDLLKNRVKTKINGINTYIPTPEFQLLLYVIQRIYRHFNIRICDIYNTANLIEKLNWKALKKISCKHGMWKGVLLYLTYIDKITKYYGKDSGIGKFVKDRKWPSKIKDRNMHFRFPIFSTGLSVYSRKVVSYLFNLNLSGLFRLCLIPPLGILHIILTAIFGEDKIW